MNEQKFTGNETSHSMHETLEGVVLRLWEQHRLRCAWHIRQDFKPHSREEMRQCLLQIAKHGDRAAYVSARRLIKCL